MLTNPSLKKHLLACAAAGGLGLFAASSTLAADSRWEASCDVCPTASPDCHCDCTKKKKHNCLYRALDAVAGGIEKLLCLDSWDHDCCKTVCDDGCDAAMIEELMVPMLSSESHHHQRQQIQPLSPPIDSDSKEQVEVTRTAPQKWDEAGDGAADAFESEMTPHRFEALDSRPQLQGNTLVETNAGPPPVDVLEPEMEIRRQPEPTRKPRTEQDSLVEPLTNPFRDDLVNPFLDDQTRTRTYQPVRPSSYDEIELRPISRRPLPNYSESSRRPRNIR